MSSCRALMGLCLLLASVHAAAAGNGKRIPPELAEAWEPEPAVVTPAEIAGEGQGRGNSGIFLMDRYEVQILDSFENRTYSNGQAGSVYKQYIPLVNASRGPGEWQSYDIIFIAPRFDDEGQLAEPARLTVLHNGVLIQNNVAIQGRSVFRGTPSYEAHGAAPIRLQDHRNPVSFRNIWVRPL